MLPALADIIMLNNTIKRPSVVRNLFGRADKESTDLELKRQEMHVMENTRNFTQKWGYDPTTEKFVSGAQYQCESFSISEYNHMPAFYTKVYAHKKCMDNSRRTSRGPARPSAAKRKLNWCDDADEHVNDENRAVSDMTTARVPCKGEVVDSVSTTVSTTRPTDTNSTSNVLCSSELSSSFGLSDCPNSDTAEIVRREFTTPPNVQLSQKTITEYLPVKKRRHSSCHKN